MFAGGGSPGGSGPFGSMPFAQLAAGVEQSAKVVSEQKGYLTALSGDKFKETYRFFHNDSIVVWDGTKVSGSNDMKAFWKLIPSTQHDVRTCDSQPINAPQINELKNTNSPVILVTVTGNVKYGVKPTQHSFHHTFVLERDLTISPNQGEFYYIVSCTVRTQKLSASKQAALASASASGAASGVGAPSGSGGGGGGGRGRGRGRQRRMSG